MLKLIVGLVAASARHPRIVLAMALLISALGTDYATRHLTMDTDTDHLFAASLPWRQAQIAEAKEFPQFDGLIVAVVHGDTPEEAVETAKALTAALKADKKHFLDARYPAGSPFYTQEGLLLLPVDRLAKLLSSIVEAQPFLGQLAADPSARGLFSGLSLLAQGVQTGQANLTPYAPALSAIQATLQAAADGHPRPLSWQSLLATGQGNDGEIVLIHPVLDQARLEAGKAATMALQRIAASLPDIRAGRATVDYTGQIPLADEEFASLTQGIVLSEVISVLLIALWLFLALRSWRLIVPIVITVFLGLTLTLSFAAVAVGVLNLISIAFAILFIGLSIDFAIQFCVRLRAVRHGTDDLPFAIPETARQAGGQIALAAAATACGFLAFAPTPFIGVAQLGIIAGTGMFIAFICTITILPALLRLSKPGTEYHPISLPFGRAGDEFLHRHQRLTLSIFALVALAGVASALTLNFDANPLHTKDPNTESMRTLSEMLNNPATNPFYADALAPDLPAAQALSKHLAALPEVSSVISGATFLPSDQTTKLAMIAQARTILAPTLLATPAPGAAAITAHDLRLSMQATRVAILKAKPQLPRNSPLLGIAGALTQLLHESDAKLEQMNASITRFLPMELAQLNISLSPQPITRASLPPEIARDWFLPDGRVRVEALPTAAAQTTSGLKRFAHAVLAVAPNAGGPAISIIATARTILASFREAALLAFAAIAIILLIVFRHLRDACLVLTALLLSALLTALFAKSIGLSINYANIIALPLLLGVGVSFNVYFVMNWRAGMQRLLQSATASAVLFSALTTSTAFGTLAASHDRGTASMGILLLLSLLAVLIVTFVFLPALLYSLAPRPSDHEGR